MRRSGEREKRISEMYMFRGGNRSREVWPPRGTWIEKVLKPSPEDCQCTINTSYKFMVLVDKYCYGPSGGPPRSRAIERCDLLPSLKIVIDYQLKNSFKLFDLSKLTLNRPM